jgi:uncharacterized cofD-like protein
VTGRRVVALGGGHGLSASLAALAGLTSELTAVVTVADDGGSSGRLRREFGCLPPGDLRMALLTLSGDDDPHRSWRDLLGHRFPGSGELGGHPVGNLLLAGMFQRGTGAVAALELAGRLLGLPAGTRVLPMSCEPVDLVASVRDPGTQTVREVRGQLAVATTTGQVVGLRLEPAPPACPEVLAELGRAEVVVLGPGSLYTSVLPNLLVADLRAALLAGRARRVLVLNLAPQAGETAGLSLPDHLDALARQVDGLTLDVVVADRSAAGDPAELAAAAGRLGARLVLGRVAARRDPRVHDPRRLGQVLAPLLAECGA